MRGWSFLQGHGRCCLRVYGLGFYGGLGSKGLGCRA